MSELSYWLIRCGNQVLISVDTQGVEAFPQARHADFGDVIKKQAASEIVKQTQTTSDAATLAAQAKSTSSPVKEDKSLSGLADKHKNPHDFINALFSRG